MDPNPRETTSALTYKRAPRAIFFPSEAEVPETRRHLELRTLLFQFLTRAFGARAAVGSDQFVYFRANDASRCVAPDAFVRLGATNEAFPTWKVWERGAPDVAVEVVSEHERPWTKKVADYAELGVRELVRFDADAPPGRRVRIWDRVAGDLVERRIRGDRATSLVLGGAWCVAPCEETDVALRLEDADGALLLTAAEAHAAEVAEQRARADEHQARADEHQARADEQRARADEHQARADALEAELARLRAERAR